MKNILRRVNKRNLAKAALIAITVMNNCMVCFANTTEAAGDAGAIAEQITSPFTTFLGVMVTIVQVMGGYLLLKGIMELSTSWKQNDDSGMVNSLKGIISGLLFLFSRLILKIFGVSV